MSTAIRLTNDYAFKRVFGSASSTPILVELLNAILGDRLPHPIVDVEVLSPFDPKHYEVDKLSILDIKAIDDAGRIYDIEMQNWLHSAYPNRAVYYLAGLIRDQLREGQHYDMLKPCIGIHFVDDRLLARDDSFHWKFCLADRDHPEVILTDLLQLDFIELPKADGKLKETDPLWKWLQLIRSGSDLDPTIVPVSQKTEGFRRALEVINVISRTEEERLRYEAREKFERDQRAFEKDAMNKGFASGKAEGLEQGKAEGWEKGKVEGKAEGRVEGLIETVNAYLESRFQYFVNPTSLASVHDLGRLQSLKEIVRTAATLDDARSRAQAIGIELP